MAGAGVRRVFVEDARGDGKFLRMTWHPDRRTFVVSTWDGTVCVGATRVPVEQAPALIDVLVRVLADAAAPETAGAPARLSLRQHLRIWWRDRTASAAIVELGHLRRPSARRSA
jgi:hypothetical protein